MADNYEFAKVLTPLPAKDFRLAHERVLTAMGWSCERWAGVFVHQHVYLHADEDASFRPVTADDLQAAFADAPESVARDPFRSSLLQLIADGKGSVDWRIILQRILIDMPDTDMPDGIPHVDVQASYWSDDARGGDFGGWAMRITRDEVRSFGTSDWLKEQQASAPATVQEPAPTPGIKPVVDSIYVETRSLDEFVEDPYYAEVPTAGLLDTLNQLMGPSKRCNLSEARALYPGIRWVADPAEESEGGEVPVDCMEMRFVASDVDQGIVEFRGMHRNTDAPVATIGIDAAELRERLAAGERYYADVDDTTVLEERVDECTGAAAPKRVAPGAR